MAWTENVKIKINEKDKTKGVTRISSFSDIVFIPGLASKLGKTPTNHQVEYNVPVLCETVREFETAFGKEIPKLEGMGSQWAHLGYKDADLDRSYIMAKELLYQGMPVVYCAIDMFDYEPSSEADLSSTYFDHITLYDSEGITWTDENEYNDLTVDFDSNTLTRRGCLNFTATCSSNYSQEGLHRVLSLYNQSFGLILKSANNDVVVSDVSIIPDFSSSYSYGNWGFLYADESKCFLKSKLAVGAVDLWLKFSFSLYFTLSYSGEIEKNNKVTTTISMDTDKIIENFKFEKVTYNLMKQNNLSSSLELLADRNAYSVKYLTSGGYPSIIKGKKSDGEEQVDALEDIHASSLLSCASRRGDCVALIDYQCDAETQLYAGTYINDELDIDGELASCIYGMAQDYFTALDTTGVKQSYGTMMHPWGVYSCPNTIPGSDYDITLPASFGYLMCVAKAIKNSPNWLAMAGVARGLVPNLNADSLITKQKLTNGIAEELQPAVGREGRQVSINCITNIRPYGLTLWGNRTLKPLEMNQTPVATCFLNTRNMISDIKKVLYSTAKSLMFEQNSDTLWVRFKNGVTPLLDQLKTGNGIEDYKIIKNDTLYDGSELAKGELSATIKIIPLYAVEFFELTVEINDKDVNVAE